MAQIKFNGEPRDFGCCEVVGLGTTFGMARYTGPVNGSLAGFDRPMMMTKDKNGVVSFYPLTGDPAYLQILGKGIYFYKTLDSKLISQYLDSLGVPEHSISREGSLKLDLASSFLPGLGPG